MRETSLETFKMIKESGLLSKRRWQVYEFIFNNGPCSARDVHKALTKSKGANSSTFMSRVTELKEMGALKEVGIRKDSETNQKVTVWDVTKEIPEKFKIKMPKDQQIKILKSTCNFLFKNCDNSKIKKEALEMLKGMI